MASHLARIHAAQQNDSHTGQSGWLTLHDDAVQLDIYPVEGEGQQIQLLQSPQRLDREVFHQQLPNRLAVETAIEHVEIDLETRPILALARSDTRFYADISDLAQLRELAGLADGSLEPFTQSDCERVFNALSALVQGTPASFAGFPEDSRLAARLVILRELMHHAGLREIHLLA